MQNKPPLVIDTSTLSNMLSGNAFYLLETLYRNKIVIPAEVYVEAIRYKPLRPRIEKAVEKEWMKLYTISEIDDLKEFAQMLNYCDSGESAVLVIAKKLNGTAVSDNIPQIFPIYQKRNIPLLGTMGILYDAYINQYIDHIKGQKIIDKIRNEGNIIPVRRFSQIIDWFKNGQGNKPLY
ncbi:hypothetical protein H0A61_02975 [Koleobacter methoxysyntrophicus]|uniref:PIN domain-containing protein n=1 Tax=Koleobacter methoxysyntrophicus TaxID=2751313 RepID=A0A8A0RQ76_9FIRM|nr:hypothetical protein [Koleobacter methoxysyntrophicus]QSQ10565.1 hypothetical protein H0A61_02975 [Koleobacter methoxysyntrophicus]